MTFFIANIHAIYLIYKYIVCILHLFYMFFDASAIYLFVLQYSDDLNATGDMPRGKQFGYLFTKTALKLGDKAIYRTIAHEIANVERSLPLQDASRSKGFS